VRLLDVEVISPLLSGFLLALLSSSVSTFVGHVDCVAKDSRCLRNRTINNTSVEGGLFRNSTGTLYSARETSLLLRVLYVFSTVRPPIFSRFSAVLSHPVFRPYSLESLKTFRTFYSKVPILIMQKSLD